MGQPYAASETLLSRRETGFNAIIIMDNSFGYCNEDCDIYMLNDLLKVSADNCILIMETENRDWRLKNFEPQINYLFEKIEVHQKWNFNLETSISEGRSKFYERAINGKAHNLLLDLRLHLRLYSLHELKNILDSAGWRYLESYEKIKGSRDKKLQAVTCDSEHIITIGRKI
jgi:hypothetical protein